jgi:hypothetical protein
VVDLPSVQQVNSRWKDREIECRRAGILGACDPAPLLDQTPTGTAMRFDDFGRFALVEEK